MPLDFKIEEIFPRLCGKAVDGSLRSLQGCDQFLEFGFRWGATHLYEPGRTRSIAMKFVHHVIDEYSHFSRAQASFFHCVGRSKLTASFKFFGSIDQTTFLLLSRRNSSSRWTSGDRWGDFTLLSASARHHFVEPDAMCNRPSTPPSASAAASGDPRAGRPLPLCCRGRELAPIWQFDAESSSSRPTNP